MTKNDLEDFERRVSLIFHGAIALTLLPFVLLYLEFSHEGMQPVYSDYWWVDAMVLIAASFIVLVAFRHYRRNVAEMERNVSLERRFEQLFRIYLSFYVRIFLASLVMVFTYWLTGSMSMVIGYVVILFLLSLHRPTRQRFVSDLPLTGAERDFILQKSQKND